MEILKLQQLRVHYKMKDAIAEAADVEWLNIRSGEMFGLVGESGCGKSTIAKAVTRLLSPNGVIHSGEIFFKGRNINRLPEKEFNHIRWKEIAIIPQSAMNSLDPVYTIREQIAEALRTHLNSSPEKIHRRIDELMAYVGLNPKRADEYPHEFSGGMRQRAMIAMALALTPSLIIADEPTTALDVIMQDQILTKIQELHKTFGMSMLLITHDIAVVAQMCDRMAVMYGGKIMELGDVRDIFRRPGHPYTIGLQKAFPSVRGRTEKLVSIPGSPPNLRHPPAGCRFFERCPWAIDLCKQESTLKKIDDGHFSACQRVKNIEEFRHEAKDISIWQRSQAAQISMRRRG
ncbi:MAG: ABC transporter ATP-binding protein [Deltaproteobacteria bacterium]|nr:ABC transporter ATP-binding protein [Deltaproteobacteria bacterium]MBW2154119.1 ABC transporter ATP-binding protein [Deltaproteobacteria bacterium]